MRSHGKTKLPAQSYRPARWEYLFYPGPVGSGADLSLSDLQAGGWVVLSSSRTEKGQNQYLLKRAKPKNAD